MKIRAFEAYNIIKSESVVVLDCCKLSARLLPGAIALDPTLSVKSATRNAYRQFLDDFGPDNPHLAILLDDDRTNDVASSHCNSTFGEEASDFLLKEGFCKQTFCVSREELMRNYSFLWDVDVLEVAAYPNEILEGALYLGSAISIAKPQRLNTIGITHVVSVIDTHVDCPREQKHLMCRITDDSASNLAPVMMKALPFITNALDGGGRVLVHCAQGQSRSASVVIAYLMQSRGLDVPAALALVKKQRPCVQPNGGFMRQLAKCSWTNVMQSPPQKRLTSQCNVGGSSELLSSDVLTMWLLSSFSQDLCIPEREALKIADMDSWLDCKFCERESKKNKLAENLGGVLVEDVLTRRECQRVIAETEKLGYGRTNFPQRYRGNRRLQIDDVTGRLAEQVWQRIRSHVPETVTADWLPQDGEYPSGVWRPVGCNTRFRFSKYFAGDGFASHVDNMCMFGPDRCSLLTVNIYLNDLEVDQCGRTRFFLKRGGEPVDRLGGLAGSAAIFNQEAVLHDGEPLTYGLKYLMRTDVIFAKVSD